MEDQRLATDAGLVQCHCGANIGAASQQQRRRVQLLEFGRHVQQRAAAQGQHACAGGAEVQIRKAAVKQHCVGIQALAQSRKITANHGHYAGFGVAQSSTGSH